MPGDASFASVSLLLHCDGTDASTTVVDSSSNVHVASATSPAEIDTAQFEYAGASLYSPGSGAGYVTVPDHASLDLGAGDWTIEYSVRLDTTTVAQNHLAKSATALTTPSWIFQTNGSNVLTFDATTDGSAPLFTQMSLGTLSADTWYKVAVTRSGNDMHAYLDGTEVDTETASGSVYDSTHSVVVAGSTTGAGSGNNMWMDQVRITKGVARYTGASYTVATEPFESAADTLDADFASVSILLHMEGTDEATVFTDSSINAHVDTVVGTVHTEADRSKFGSTSLAGPSAATNHLSFANSDTFDFGTGAFTIEFWFYPPTSGPANGPHMVALGTGATFNPFVISLAPFSAVNLKLYLSSTGSSYNIANGIALGTAVASSWNHVAVSRAAGGTEPFELFLNGTRTATQTWTGAALYDRAAPLYVGGETLIAGMGSGGGIDELRITKGVARYTGTTYVVPTNAFGGGANAVNKAGDAGMEINVPAAAVEWVPATDRTGDAGMEISIPAAAVEYRYSTQSADVGAEISIPAAAVSFSSSVKTGDAGMEISIPAAAVEFISSATLTGANNWGLFVGAGTHDADSKDGDVTWPLYTVEGAMSNNSVLAGDLNWGLYSETADATLTSIFTAELTRPVYSISASTPPHGNLTWPLYETEGTLLDGPVWAGEIETPAYTALGTLLAGVYFAGTLTAPSRQITAAMIAEGVFAGALTMRGWQARGTALGGSYFTAALTAPTWASTGIAYGLYTLTGALEYPAYVVAGDILTEIADTFATWVLTLGTPGLTSYTGYDFNSYANFRGASLAAGATGIVVQGGDDDAATAIIGLVRTGKENFGTSFNKRVPRLYFEGKAAGDLHVSTITTQGGTRTYLLPYNGASGVQVRRVPIGRGPKSPHWQFEVTNPNGEDFTLSSLQPRPEAGKRRVV